MELYIIRSILMCLVIAFVFVSVLTWVLAGKRTIPQKYETIYIIFIAALIFLPFVSDEYSNTFYLTLNTIYIVSILIYICFQVYDIFIMTKETSKKRKELKKLLGDKYQEILNKYNGGK